MTETERLESFHKHNTRLQKKVIELLFQGCSNGDIGKQIGISENTVKNHLNRIYKREHITGRCKRIKLVILIHSRQKANEKKICDITPNQC